MTIDITYSLNDISKVASLLIEKLKMHKILAFNATMGTGKTTLINEICKQLGVVETSSSPTFSIINEYEKINKEIIYHYDFYRIDIPEEVFDLGVEEQFYSGNLCLIEWPENVAEYLPSETIFISIVINNDNSRTLKVTI